jgi:enamine deaminase RidA (YjgF/YER057c/UK114 family)
VSAQGEARGPGAAPRQQSPAAASVVLRAIEADPGRGRAAAVVVEQGALVHSTLLSPLDSQMRLRGAGDAYAQAAYVLGTLDTALRAAGTGLDRLVRLHVYVADASVTPAIDRLLAERFGGPTQPAVTIVESRMPHAGVLVAMDAIAATPRQATAGTSERISVAGLPPTVGGGAHVAVQPDGPFVIVSGRAAPGEFDAAVRATMEQLRGDLAGVGLGLDHVVQVKAFLGDMGKADQLQRLVAGTFQGTAPPQVVTEWRDASLPVEIEAVATAPGATPGADRVSFVEPILSRYSRVARVLAGRPVFISGLTGAPAEPAAQVRDVFAQLQRLLASAGSDMRHLVKATYYVSDQAADQEINTIRPSVYDAARPPAASKISVQGTGRAGKSAVIDMIAVTTGR